MADNPANNNELLQVHRSAPPDWLPKIHSHADLGQFYPAALQPHRPFNRPNLLIGFAGYHGFQPPRPGQAEDELSQSNVKSGLTLGSASVCELFVGTSSR